MPSPLAHKRRHTGTASAVLTGTWLNAGSVVAAEIAALAGFDWLLIDREHGSGSEADAALQFLAATAGGSSPVIRVSGLVPGEIKRLLDHGPAGIMIPSVDSVNQAREAVRLVRLPPLGQRQTATSTRAVEYGRTAAAYQSSSNTDLVLLVQIESAEAVAAAPEIAALPGIDVLFVGPNDLGHSMGIDPNSAAPRFHEAVQSVARAAALHGKDAGILARNEEQAARYAAQGFRWIAMGSDRGILHAGFTRTAKALAALRLPGGAAD